PPAKRNSIARCTMPASLEFLDSNSKLVWRKEKLDCSTATNAWPLRVWPFCKKTLRKRVSSRWKPEPLLFPKTSAAPKPSRYSRRFAAQRRQTLAHSRNESPVKPCFAIAQAIPFQKVTGSVHPVRNFSLDGVVRARNPLAGFVSPYGRSVSPALTLVPVLQFRSGLTFA